MSRSLGLFRFKMAMTIPTWGCREGEMERSAPPRGATHQCDAGLSSSVPQGACPVVDGENQSSQ